MSDEKKTEKAEAKAVTLYHDAKEGGITFPDGTQVTFKDGAVQVSEDKVASLCETFGFRTTKEKPAAASAVAQQSELEALKARIAELEARKK